MKGKAPATDLTSLKIPARCRLVYQALQGVLGHTDFTRRTGRWRYIDLIQITGRNSSDRKLRQLIEICPGLVSSEERLSETGTRYKVFWLTSRGSVSNGLRREKVTPGSDGVLFHMPPHGRPE